eukprot:gene14436-15940_t
MTKECGECGDLIHQAVPRLCEAPKASIAGTQGGRIDDPLTQECEECAGRKWRNVAAGRPSSPLYAFIGSAKVRKTGRNVDLVVVFGRAEEFVQQKCGGSLPLSSVSRLRSQAVATLRQELASKLGLEHVALDVVGLGDGTDGLFLVDGAVVVAHNETLGDMHGVGGIRRLNVADTVVVVVAAIVEGAQVDVDEALRVLVEMGDVFAVLRGVPSDAKTHKVRDVLWRSRGSIGVVRVEVEDDVFSDAVFVPVPADAQDVVDGVFMLSSGGGGAGLTGGDALTPAAALVQSMAVSKRRRLLVAVVKMM